MQLAFQAVLTLACLAILAGCDGRDRASDASDAAEDNNGISGGCGRGDGGWGGNGAAGQPAAGDAAVVPLAGTGGTHADASTCSAPETSYEKRIDWRTSRAWTVDDYEGPAVVERSTADELVLYVASASMSSGDASGARSRITGQGTLPLLGPGSEVWLFQSHNERCLGFICTPPAHGPRLAIRDRQGGTLILGALRDQVLDDDSVAEPLAFTKPLALCTAPTDDTCVIDGRVTYHSIEARADAPVRLEPGEGASIELDGIEYTLELLSAASLTDSGSTTSCADFYGYSDGVWIEANVRPQRDADVTAELEPSGVLPECTLGNDPVELHAHGFYALSVSTVYEGPITYMGMENDELLFSLPNSPGTFYLTPASWLEELTLGEELWLSANLHAFALRQTQTGPLLAAAIWSLDNPPLSVEQADTFSSWLGVPVTVEPRCDYEGEVRLHDAILGTAPPVRIQAGSAEQLTLEGRTYRAATHLYDGDLWYLKLVPSGT